MRYVISETSCTITVERKLRKLLSRLGDSHLWLNVERPIFEEWSLIVDSGKLYKKAPALRQDFEVGRTDQYQGYSSKCVPSFFSSPVYRCLPPHGVITWFLADVCLVMFLSNLDQSSRWAMTVIVLYLIHAELIISSNIIQLFLSRDNSNRNKISKIWNWY